MSDAKSKIISAALLIGSFNFLSQIFGLIRDRLLAANVGVGPELDIYYAAFRIPDTIYFLIYSCVSGIALIPFFTKKSKEEGDLSNSIFSVIFFFTTFLATLSLVAYFNIEKIVDIYVPGFSDEQKLSLVQLVSILLLQPIILSISNVFAFLLQFKNKILTFSLSPVIYNMGGIIGAAFLYDIFGLIGLGYGVLLGAFLQLLFLFANIVTLKNFQPNIFKYKLIFSDICFLIKTGLPRTLALIVSQMRNVSFITFGAFLGAGAISAYSLSYAVFFVPINLFVISYVLVIYPRLCREGNTNFVKDVADAYRYLLFITLPAVAIFIFLRAHIVRILYGGQSFTWENTTVVAAALGILALSIPFVAFKTLSTRVLFAKEVIWKQSILEALLFVFQVILIYFFAKHLYIFDTLKHSNIFRLKDIEDFNALIIPIVFLFVNILDFIVFHSVQWRFIKTKVFKNISPILYSNFIFGLMIYFGLNIFDFILHTNFADHSIFFAVFLHATFSLLFAFIFWYISLRAFGSEELEKIESAIVGRFWKKKIDAPHESIEVGHKI